MGDDNAASDRPDRGPDRGPDGSPSSDQPAARVGADQARSHLSRSEYASRLRAIGWGRDTWENNPKLELAERELAENSERRTGPGDAILKMSISSKMVIEHADIRDDKIYLTNDESIPVSEKLKTGEAVGEVPTLEKSLKSRLRDKAAEGAGDLYDALRTNGTLAWDVTQPEIRVPGPPQEHAASRGIAVPDAIGAGFVVAVTGVLVVAKIRDSSIVDRVTSSGRQTLASVWVLLEKGS
jgi:hypothetical protein